MKLSALNTPAALPTFSSNGSQAMYIKPSKALSAFDYTRGRSISNKLIDSTFKQNLVMYIALVISRSAASFVRGLEVHSQRETVEHMSRDIPSIFMAYFGARLLLKTLTVTLFKNDKEKLLHLPKATLNNGDTWWKRVKNNFKYISKGKMVTAEEIVDIMSDHISQLRKEAQKIGKTVSREELKPIIKYFKKLKFKRNAVNFAGTAFNLALMGFIIPYVNIIVTQAYAKGYHQKQAQAGHSYQK